MRAPEERLADVVRAVATGAGPKFVFFWKERDLYPGCLSQWWPAPFVVDGVRYPTAEHWMMAGKARLFEDAAALGKVLEAPTPQAATGDRVLVEASPLDRVWGIGLAVDDEAAASPARWRGRNLLGFALMEVRDRL